MTVDDQWSLISESSSKTFGNEEHHPEVGQPTSDIEVFNWEFSNDGDTKKASNLSSGGIVSPVPV